MVLQILFVSKFLYMLNMYYSNLYTQEGKQLKKSGILHWQRYYQAKTFIKVCDFF